MPEPQEPRETGGRDDAVEETESTGDSRSSDAAEPEPAPEDSFDWPTEDPETSRAESSPEAGGDPDVAEPEWPEHDPAAVERTQRFDAIEPVAPTDGPRPSSDATPKSDAAADPPTIRMAPVSQAAPSQGEDEWPRVDPDPAEPAGRPPERRTDRFTTHDHHPTGEHDSAEQRAQSAGEQSSGQARPASPADFGMPDTSSGTAPPSIVRGEGPAESGPDEAEAPGHESGVESGDGDSPPSVGAGTVEHADVPEHPETAPFDAGTAEVDERAVAPASEESGGEGEPASGRKKPFHALGGRTALVTAVALVAVIALAGLAVFRGPGWFGELLRTRADPPAPVRLSPDVRGLRSSAPVPTEQGVEAALSEISSAPALGGFGAVVRDARSGRTLWQRDPTHPLVPASTNKLLTSCAALLAMDHGFRFTTKVVRGSEPGSVVLVGGGDPTLSSLPQGQESVYPGAARLDELVDEVREVTSGEIESVKVDVGRYSGPGLEPSWSRGDVSKGYVAPIQPVMLDGGRQDPTSKVSRRSEEPALDAARELASRLGAPTDSVSETTVGSNAATLAEVESPPLRDLVRKTLRDSDNVLAEAIARQVARTTGHEASFTGAVRAVREVLSRNGFDLTGVEIVDGSGLSFSDHLPARVLGEVMRVAAAPVERPDGRSARLRPLLTSLPVAGGSGGLAGRYEGDAAPGRGWVRAKTGTLTGTNALAGIVVTRDGRLLVFAFLSNGMRPAKVRPMLDELAARLRSCGCR
ncbi:D-alanyl-D-alanine carboxypeptidase / D-alanyl-D-alanine-endopeptidase (penicillin-binding protein 4) [Actinopolyspora xinjiangensis]|uniref:D-alanyl-D-alanine carboxypeptidase / D-alanyl-D-alanine-endopeptidase (Penicillin-binding protein 4) n=1 Tax=Actinopolyspora xinjiangensis TaxID=405564 RepID=A0A1H0WXA0_9ACTN|nr:D-alanyl-D-alanine carboxypeptidase/D-alanyl-D-alanine-endopeptidase [Actinopolyspora xinjiangensis]SDP95378.1 D-alanyl-D-alanine carboxypeptidase / D-alanyl-D-alanine-endopeptidase (penicillin-binding protein 4) [Actinopolyspora xinjiangensis]